MEVELLRKSVAENLQAWQHWHIVKMCVKLHLRQRKRSGGKASRLLLRRSTGCTAKVWIQEGCTCTPLIAVIGSLRLSCCTIVFVISEATTEIWKYLNSCRQGAKNCLRNYAYAYVNSAPKCIRPICALKSQKFSIAPPQTPLPLGRGHPLPRPTLLGTCVASNPCLRRGGVSTLGYSPPNTKRYRRLCYSSTRIITSCLNWIIRIVP